jgi:hypothetical protein
MITFVCWKWSAKLYRHVYTAEHVNEWADGFRRSYERPHRLICITDDPSGIEIETARLWTDHRQVENPSGAHLPSCYRRLKLFDPATQRTLGIKKGTRVGWLDLDVVFTGDCSPIFDAHPGAPFVGWKGLSPSHGRPVYNGTLVMFEAGNEDVARLWTEFDPDKSPHDVAKARYFGSDQGWISYRLAGRAAGVSERHGIFSFNRDMLLQNVVDLPDDARLVSFNGKAKPWHEEIQQRHPWVRKHWGLR